MNSFSYRWTDFYRSMFWLAVICGGLMVLHAFLLIILKFGKRNSEKHRKYGALKFPRFEIFLVFLALPSICKASAVLIRGNRNFIIVNLFLWTKNNLSQRKRYVRFLVWSTTLRTGLDCGVMFVFFSSVGEEICLWSWSSWWCRCLCFSPFFALRKILIW